jgi:hypothetical protein
LRPSRAAVTLFGAASALDLIVYPPLVAAGGQLQRRQALTAHKVLVVERLLLSAAFVAARAPRLALILAATTVPISAGLQALMRDRHEQQAPDLARL